MKTLKLTILALCLSATAILGTSTAGPAAPANLTAQSNTEAVHGESLDRPMEARCRWVRQCIGRTDDSGPAMGCHWVKVCD